jgi:hypothetical protein
MRDLVQVQSLKSKTLDCCVPSANTVKKTLYGFAGAISLTAGAAVASTVKEIVKQHLVDCSKVVYVMPTLSLLPVYCFVDDLHIAGKVALVAFSLGCTVFCANKVLERKANAVKNGKSEAVAAETTQNGHKAEASTAKKTKEQDVAEVKKEEKPTKVTPPRRGRSKSIANKAHQKTE